MADSVEPTVLLDKATGSNPDTTGSWTAPLPVDLGDGLSSETVKDTTTSGSAKRSTNPNTSLSTPKDTGVDHTKESLAPENLPKQGNSTIGVEGISEPGTVETHPPTAEDLPNADETKKEADQVSIEAKKAFLEFYRRLDNKNFRFRGGSETLDNLDFANNYILLNEQRMSLHSRIKRSQFLSFTFQSYLRLIEDRQVLLLLGETVYIVLT